VPRILLISQFGPQITSSLLLANLLLEKFGKSIRIKKTTSEFHSKLASFQEPKTSTQVLVATLVLKVHTRFSKNSLTR